MNKLIFILLGVMPGSAYADKSKQVFSSDACLRFEYRQGHLKGGIKMKLYDLMIDLCRVLEGHGKDFSLRVEMSPLGEDVKGMKSWEKVSHDAIGGWKTWERFYLMSPTGDVKPVSVGREEYRDVYNSSSPHATVIEDAPTVGEMVAGETGGIVLGVYYAQTRRTLSDECGSYETSWGSVTITVYGDGEEVEVFGERLHQMVAEMDDESFDPEGLIWVSHRGFDPPCRDGVVEEWKFRRGQFAVELARQHDMGLSQIERFRYGISRNGTSVEYGVVVVCREADTSIKYSRTPNGGDARLIELGKGPLAWEIAKEVMW